MSGGMRLIRLPKVKWLYPEREFAKPPTIHQEIVRDGVEDLFVDVDRIVSIRPAYHTVNGCTLQDSDWCVIMVECGKDYREYQILGTARDVAKLCGYKSMEPPYTSQEPDFSMAGKFKVVPS